MKTQRFTEQNTTLGLGQRLGKGLFWILKQFIQASLILCTGAVTYALIDGTAVQGLAIPGMIVVMLLVGRLIYKPAFGTTTVIANTVPGSQDDKNGWDTDDDLVTNPVYSHLQSNIWHHTSDDSEN